MTDVQNGYVKTAVTVILTAIVTAMFTLLMDSKANERTLAQHDEWIKDIQKRIVVVETQNAGVRAELSALQSKVDDIWKVTVMGERPRTTR